MTACVPPSFSCSNSRLWVRTAPRSASRAPSFLALTSATRHTRAVSIERTPVRGRNNERLGHPQPPPTLGGPHQAPPVSSEPQKLAPTVPPPELAAGASVAGVGELPGGLARRGRGESQGASGQAGGLSGAACQVVLGLGAPGECFGGAARLGGERSVALGNPGLRHGSPSPAQEWPGRGRNRGNLRLQPESPSSLFAPSRCTPALPWLGSTTCFA